jgi:membrane protein YqaA with SNARE-associated domain
VSHHLLELFGVYGACLAISFIAGMFPLVSIEAFFIAYCSLEPVSIPMYIALVLIAAFGHQIAKTICYFAGVGALENKRIKPQLEKWRPRIERWNRYPKTVFFAAAAVGIPPMWLVAFIAEPIMKIRFWPFTLACFACRAGRYAVLAAIPLIAK